MKIRTVVPWRRLVGVAGVRNFSRTPAAVAAGAERDGLAATAPRSLLTRNAYFLILNTGINSLLGVGFWAVASRLFSRQIVGASGSLISLMVFLASLSQFNLSLALPRLLQIYGRQARRLVRMSYIACSIAGIIASLVVVGVSALGDLGGVMGSLSPLARLVFVLGVGQWTVFTLQDAVLTGLRRAGFVPLENMIFGIIKLVMLFALASGSGQGTIFYSWMIAVPFIAIPLNLAMFLRYLPAHERLGGSDHLDRNILVRFLGVEYVGSVFAQLSSNLLPVLVANQLGAVANSSFYSAWVLITALDTVANNFAISFSVEATRDPANFDRYLAHAERRVVQILGPALIATAIGAPLLLMLFGSTYADTSSGLLRIMLLGTAARAINLLALGMHRARASSGHVLKIQAIMGLSVISLSVVGTIKDGVAGVAWAFVVGNALTAIVSLRDIRALRRPNVPASSLPVCEAAAPVRTEPAPSRELS